MSVDRISTTAKIRSKEEKRETRKDPSSGPGLAARTQITVPSKALAYNVVLVIHNTVSSEVFRALGFWVAKRFKILPTFIHSSIAYFLLPVFPSLSPSFFISASPSLPLLPPQPWSRNGAVLLAVRRRQPPLPWRVGKMEVTMMTI